MQTLMPENTPSFSAVRPLIGGGGHEVRLAIAPMLGHYSAGTFNGDQGRGIVFVVPKRSDLDLVARELQKAIPLVTQFGNDSTTVTIVETRETNLEYTVWLLIEGDQGVCAGGTFNADENGILVNTPSAFTLSQIANQLSEVAA